MNTKITITANGNFSPNVVFDLGNKYESVGDTLEFVIPDKYKLPTNHYYLTLKMKKKPTQILPVNDFIFVIDRTVTENAGTYEMIFLATENEIVNGDIDEAKKVFVSNTMYGLVRDNFLTDPVTSEEYKDANIDIYYTKLDALKDELEYKKGSDYYRGDYYLPSVDEFGYLTWTINKGQASEIPQSQNITGPEGPFYVPAVNDGILSWSVAQGQTRPDTDTVDFKEMTRESTDTWLNLNFTKEVSPLIKEAVNTAVDAKFKFTWDDENQILYITTEEQNG